MKKTIKLSVLGIIAILGLFVSGNKVSAQVVNPISCNTATLNGHIEPNGASTQVWFNWGTTTSFSYSTPKQTFNASSDYNSRINNLTESTTYYYAAMASNTNGTSVGQTFSFTTPSCVNATPSPTVNITANPTSVSYNGSSIISWSSTNATSCSASSGTNGWSGTKATSGSFSTGALTYATTYNIVCSNSTGQASASTAVSVTNNGGGQNSLPRVDIYADDTRIDYDEDTRIRWDSSDADYCTASGGTNDWSGNRSTSGSFYTGRLTSDRTYRITCYNNYGSENDSITVYVDNDNNDDERPDVTTRSASSITTSSATLNGLVDGNGSSTRAWFEYGTNINLGQTTVQSTYGSGSTSYSKSISGLFSNTTYYFRAVAENSQDIDYGTVFSFRTVNSFVAPPVIINNQPTAIIYASSTNLAYNSATTVYWGTVNATSCFASGGSTGWAGAKSIGPGSFYTGSLTGSRTYTITCSNSFGSSTDSVTINVRGQVINNTTTRPAPTSLVLITSSVDRNQPIVPTLDNTRPRPGDEINYTVTYQNIGTGSITNLVLRLDLPREVDYVLSNPNNPTRSGNTLIFNLGTLRANGEGTVTVKVRVREDAPSEAFLNFPAVLSYTDPAGNSQSVNANVSAQVLSESNQRNNETVFLGANVFGAGFFPSSLFGWIILLVLILVLALIVRRLFAKTEPVKVNEESSH